jgi:uncharacterized protein (DUF302 family)
MQQLAFQVELPIPYTDAIDQVTHALHQKGFGVLTRIDVKATLKEKINADFRPYVILGACNPRLAYRALTSESTFGLLLPCNVTVEETKDGALVSIINPEAMLATVDISSSPEVRETASKARALLESVAKELLV